jgi:glutamate-5-semialdehyde dehydrogenase
MLNASDRVIVNGVPVAVGPDIARAFGDGDLLFGVAEDRLLHVSAEVNSRVKESVDRASLAFEELQRIDQQAITDFFNACISALKEPSIREALMLANRSDVERAVARGRSTTRLELTDPMLDTMIQALDLWRHAEERPDVTTDRVEHYGWSVEVIRASLGVIAFVFEGRPNVFSDALGVLRMGNTCVFRIGSDALETARSMMSRVISPALRRCKLPEDAVVLIDDESHASAWSLFSQKQVALAVARGSGAAVADLGAVARQSGIAVSLHGTGGAWMFVIDGADSERVYDTVRHSLDRKVCNTLNVVCLVGDGWREHIDDVIRGVESAAQQRGSSAVIHDLTGECRSDNDSTRVLPASETDLAQEWEWENEPEVSIAKVAHLDEAIELFNRYSPRFILSVVSPNPEDMAYSWAKARAPFVGDGMTRWVDGQFALRRPELGLSNWEHGPSIGRGAVLSGGDAFCIRYRVVQTDANVHR